MKVTSTRLYGGRTCLQSVWRLFLTTRLYGDTRARYQPLRRLIFISEFEGFCTFLLQDCTGAHYPTAGGRRGSELGGLLQIFLTTRLHGGNHPCDACFFPRRKPIIFYIIIIMHLLRSCIHCDLDHSCSILHKSRDCFRPIFSRLPECTMAYYQTARWLFSQIWGLMPIFWLPDCTGASILMMAAFPPRRKPIIFNNNIALITLLH